MEKHRLNAFYDGYSPEKDQAIEILVGRSADAAGSNFTTNQRELNWWGNKLELLRAAQRLRQSGIATEMVDPPPAAARIA